jgi:hypothetical protein
MGLERSGLAIYDTMQFIRPAVSTLCVGQAASMASLLLQPPQEPPLATAPRQERPTPKIKKIAKLTTAVVLAAIAIVLRDAVSRPCDQPLTLLELRSPSGWNLLDRQRGGPGHCGLDLLTHFSL